ncbi:hypothetical protein C8J56DRAFT_922866 [Mycena floridula]|nr:hypothetical protein C8J56DRAFT_922866 [Mycena floridula]
MVITAFTCQKCGHQDVVEEYKSPLPSHLLETNDPALASEDHSLREMLAKSDFEGEIALLDAQISHFQEVLGALTRRREKTVESSLAAKGVLSAIRRVPAEIIGEIVLLALLASDGSVKPVSLNVKEGLWVYSQVCRLWRKEILSLTNQWSNIHIRHTQDQVKKNAHLPAVLTEILRRSQSRPLRLCLRLEVESRAKDILTVAVEESERWKDVRLHLSDRMAIPLKPLQDRIPLLESFHLEFSSGSKGHLLLGKLSQCFRKAPALRKLHLQGVDNIHFLDVPWTQLSHFGGIESSDLLPKLTDVVSLAVSSSRYFQSTSRQFQLDNLLTLNIAECHEPPSCLRVPALQELKVAADSLGRVSAFIRQSPCHLRHLCIDFPISVNPPTIDKLWNRPNAEALFRQVPKLVTLEFECRWYFFPVEREMVMKVSDLLRDTTLLPALCCLVFDQSVLEVSVEPLIAVVQSRIGTLTEILFTGHHNSIMAANQECLETIRQCGIKVLMNAAKTSACFQRQLT